MNFLNWIIIIFNWKLCCSLLTHYSSHVTRYASKLFWEDNRGDHGGHNRCPVCGELGDVKWFFLGLFINNNGGAIFNFWRWIPLFRAYNPICIHNNNTFFIILNTSCFTSKVFTYILTIFFYIFSNIKKLFFYIIF